MSLAFAVYESRAAQCYFLLRPNNIFDFRNVTKNNVRRSEIVNFLYGVTRSTGTYLPKTMLHM